MLIYFEVNISMARTQIERINYYSINYYTDYLSYQEHSSINAREPQCYTRRARTYDTGLTMLQSGTSRCNRP